MNITETDLALAAALYPILVECARESPPRRVTYGALLQEAKARFPNVDAVQKAIPISLGRRLDVVRIFLDEKRLPNLTSLIVNADTGEVGSAFGTNPEMVRDEVAAFDWTTVSEEFDLHISGLRKKAEARSRPKISRDEAKAMMVAYYQAHKAVLPKEIARGREAIIERICSGMSTEEAFASASPIA